MKKKTVALILLVLFTLGTLSGCWWHGHHGPGPGRIVPPGHVR